MTRTSSPDPVRSVARGGALNLFGAAVYGIANFGFVFLVARQLGAKAAGPLLVGIAVFTVARGIAVLGANTGLIRMISRERALGNHHHLRPLVRIAIGPVALAACVLAATMFAAAEPLAALFDGGPTLATTLRILAPSLPFAAVATVLVQGTRGFDTMRVQVVIDRIGTSLALPAVTALVIAAGGDERAVAVSFASITVIGFLAVTVAFRRLLRQAEATVVDAAPVADTLRPDFWHFSLPRALGQSCNVAVLWLDTLLIAAWRGSTEAGIYAAGTRYLLIGTFTAEAVMNAVGPRVSGLLTARRLSDAQAVVTEATVWQAAIIVPTYLTVALFAHPLLALFGPEYVRAETALVILAVAMIGAGLCGPADSVVLMSGRSRLSLTNSAIALTVNVVGNVALTPRWGITGAGAAWAATLLVAYGLPVRQARRALGITTWSPTLAAQTGLAFATVGGTGVVARATLGPTAASLIASTVVGGALYALFTWRHRDALALRSLIPSRTASVVSTGVV